MPGADAKTEGVGTVVVAGAANLAIAIGLLLVVAITLAKANIPLLVGRSVPERLRHEIAAEPDGLPAVERIDTLLTMQLGPEDMLVAAKVDFRDDATGADIEAAADEAERRLTARCPEIGYVFLDPTPSRPETRNRRTRHIRDEPPR